MVLGADMYLVLSPDPCDTGERNGGYQASESDSPVAAPDPTISVGMALDVLWHDKKHATDMKKIMLAMISFCIFVAAMFLHIPTTNMYHQHYGVSSTLATSGDDTVTDSSPVKFYNIETISDIFDWLNDTFIPQVFVTTDYNGIVLPEDQWGRIATFNKVLGAIHFEVTYMQSGECDTPDFLADIYTSCYDSSSTTTDELLISINTNASDAAALLTEKKDSGTWIDSSTQQLVITVITLNGQLPGYAVTKLQFDFNDGGYVQPAASTTSTLLDQYPSATPIVLDALVVLWFSPWILVPAIIQYGRSYEKKHRLATPKHWLKLAKHTAKAIGVWAFPDGWFAIDFFRGPIVYLFYITVLITQVVTMNSDFKRKLVALGNGGQTDSEASDTLASVTSSFRTIANLTVLLRLFATAAVLVLGLRILNTFRDHVGLSILTRTMASAVRSFWTFSVIFAVVFVAFAVGGTVLFGDRVEDFSSFMNAMKSCVNMIYGDFDFDSIKDIDYSVVYYWSYMAMETFVLLNIVLAIVVDAYQEEKTKKDKNKCWVFFRVASNVFRQWLARANDLVWIPCCRRENRRHEVVFWGRIRPVVLHDVLRAKLDEGRCGDPYLDWTPQTLISATTLSKFFPEARIEECRATMEHLTVEQRHQSSHDLIEETAAAGGSLPAPETKSKLDSIRSVQSPTDSMPDDLSYTPTTKSNRGQAGIDADHLATNDELIIRIDALQQKLNLLIEKMSKQEP
ncbi:Ca2-modulated nonselective cation channel polycystin [Phytophthora cinnamomi]|uniref:Ca2-modulated nonselective cation channel polycystin n=1 Tax=Phytophthora cinnamomi TaxID=4785 RepID=UPI00355AAB8A|nr:Ca2-modulated nonselective cation channel polycystin [Phytophthora cinnamomi]